MHALRSESQQLLGQEQKGIPKILKENTFDIWNYKSGACSIIFHPVLKYGYYVEGKERIAELLAPKLGKLVS